MYQEQDKSRRLRIIIISVVAAVLVAIVGVWLVTAAMRSVNRGKTSDTEKTTNVATTKDSPAVAAPSSTSVSSPASQYEKDKSAATSDTSSTNPSSSSSNTSSTNSSSTSSTSNSSTTNSATNPANTPAADTVPSTGPSSVIFSALLIGVAVYLLGLNLQLKSSKNVI